MDHTMNTEPKSPTEWRMDWLSKTRYRFVKTDSGWHRETDITIWRQAGRVLRVAKCLLAETIFLCRMVCGSKRK